MMKQRIKEHRNNKRRFHKKIMDAHMLKHNRPPSRKALTIMVSLMVFVVMSVTMLILGGFLFIIDYFEYGEIHLFPNLFITWISPVIASVLIGTMVAAMVSKIPLRPINTMIFGMNELAKGNFKTRIQLGSMAISKEMENSFNTLAEELESTEIFRSDFINDFSHEFKTPIVSIRGFAKLLLKSNLSEEQRREYLEIIFDESNRLTDLATNMLNLSKVEKQKILTDRENFNLSEQIRNCILLLEKKWLNKNITMNADFNECMIYGNEELLKQIWINIIDNSIKFSPEGESIDLYIRNVQHEIAVEIINHGPKIEESEKVRLFDKFWQGDVSHSSEGTGIGLSIAKRIVELHSGKIEVISDEYETKFIIHIPKVQEFD